jgi:hypothetical protein
MILSVPPGKWRDSTPIRKWPLPSKSLPIHLSSYHSTSYNTNTSSVIEKVTKRTDSIKCLPNIGSRSIYLPPNKTFWWTRFLHGMVRTDSWCRCTNCGPQATSLHLKLKQLPLWRTPQANCWTPVLRLCLSLCIIWGRFDTGGSSVGSTAVFRLLVDITLYTIRT